MMRSLVALGAAAGAAALLLYYSRSSGKAPASGADDTYEAPALTEEETLEIMRTILDNVKMMAMRMLQASEGIKQQMQAQGHAEIDDRKLMQTFIYQHFIDAMEGIQAKALAEHDAEESEIEEAVNEYVKTDSELQEIVKKLKAIHYQFGGEGDNDSDGSGSGGVDEGAEEGEPISLEELLMVINTLSSRIGDQMDEYIVDFKDEYGLPSESTIEQFHHGFMRLTEKIEKETTKELNVSMVAFQRAVERHSSEPVLQMAFQRMQMVSAEKMQEHGIR